jgi:pyrroline-5-carboxylate reductase
MKFNRISIIGGGNLGASLTKGLLKTGDYKKENIIISEIRERRRQYLNEMGFQVTNNNKKAVSEADLIIIAVKPQQVNTLLDEISGSINKDKQIIAYTVSGLALNDVEKKLGVLPIFRLMPNTAIEIRESMTCISYKNAEEKIVKSIISLFNKLGKTIVILEELMAAATVLGACGIAFALRYMRAASQGGIEIGFSAEVSQLITAQTLKGAARLIIDSGNHPEREIDKVTTPQGITISGLNEMEHQGFSSALIKGLITSYNKLEKLQTNNT